MEGTLNTRSHKMNLRVQHFDRISDCFKRDGGDSIVQRIPLASGIDDPKMIELQAYITEERKGAELEPGKH